ncbi:MAG: MarR family transcriptional regulator [Chloroflexi bacterium]|nr:MAG: MarR family transcriptional regulator [Chloroflexota bacterium]TMF39024.1 MAG: MarR family transcriptional regulator [Chloroflexota bacterium]
MDVKTGEERSDRGLVALVTQLSKALHRRSTDELLGMRLKAYMALGYIRDHPGTTQQELENGLWMDANTVVLILNELEAAQFSVRRRDPQDRRRHLVELTAAGRHAIERADKARETLEEEILAPLSAEERKTLTTLVERVLEGLLQETHG